MFGLSDSVLQALQKTFEKHSQIHQVILFGSRAMGNFKNGSDIDIAIKGDISFDLLAKVKYELEEETLIPYFFDIVDYHTLQNENLKKHIDEFGKVIYIKG